MSEPTPISAPPTTDATADAIINESKPVEDEVDPVLTRKKLERQLSLRPEKKELVDRNILKDSSVAPALQAAQAELQRSQLEDKLDQALQQRPAAEELVKDGILKADEAPVS